MSANGPSRHFAAKQQFGRFRGEAEIFYRGSEPLNVEHTEGDGAKMFEAVCKLGLEGIVSKRIDASYRSGPSKSWIKVKNPEGSGRDACSRRSVPIVKSGPCRRGSYGGDAPTKGPSERGHALRGCAASMPRLGHRSFALGTRRWRACCRGSWVEPEIYGGMSAEEASRMDTFAALLRPNACANISGRAEDVATTIREE